MKRKMVEKDFFSQRATKDIIISSIPKKCTPIILVEGTKNQNLFGFKLSNLQKNFLKETGFSAKKDEIVYLPDDKGKIALVLIGKNLDFRETGALIKSLTVRKYSIVNPLSQKEYSELIFGFLISGYYFNYYLSNRAEDDKASAKLCVPRNIDVTKVIKLVNSDFLARDLINTPASHLNPEKLEKVIKTISRTYKAKTKVIRGNQLLDKGFPLIHAVGRAANSEPRMIELVWGRKSSPSITLVGKGVCFDTGGLNLKTSNSMGLMKKDMGGSAVAIALASFIMSRDLNIYLRLIVPAVENSVSGDSFRPGDILTSRKGKTIEVNNTDAEGRLILADALTYADETKPSLIVSLATLTGAARVALGTEIVPFYCDDDNLSDLLSAISKDSKDPLWRMPFYKPYESYIKSNIADLDNAPSGAMAGSITAALFLKQFVNKTTRLVHFDLYAWNQKETKIFAKGAKAQTLPALVELVELIASKKKNYLN